MRTSPLSACIVSVLVRASQNASVHISSLAWLSPTVVQDVTATSRERSADCIFGDSVARPDISLRAYSMTVTALERLRSSNASHLFVAFSSSPRLTSHPNPSFACSRSPEERSLLTFSTWLK